MKNIRKTISPRFNNKSRNRKPATALRSPKTPVFQGVPGGDIVLASGETRLFYFLSPCKARLTSMTMNVLGIEDVDIRVELNEEVLTGDSVNRVKVDRGDVLVVYATTTLDAVTLSMPMISFLMEELHNAND